jgi:hypothetical protein
MRDLAHARAKITAAPHKLARDVRSYEVETGFLRSQACAQLARPLHEHDDDATTAQTSGVVYLARALHCESHVDRSSLIDSSFCVVLEDFCHLDGWKQKPLVTVDELRAALTGIARFHAFFWNGRVGRTPPTTDNDDDDGDDGDEVQRELEGAVWDSGCYWSPKRQASDQIDRLHERFEKHGYATSFAPLVAERGGPSAEALLAIPAKLTAAAHAAARQSHLYLEPECGADGREFTDAGTTTNQRGAEVQTQRSKQHPQRTLIHGDLKAGNMFFRQRRGTTTTTNAVDVGFIDYQWSGWGLGAVDLAYMFCAAAGPETLDLTPDAEAEAALLQHYHKALCEALAEFGAASSAEAAAVELQPFELLQAQYEAALLDHAVTVFSYMWNGLQATPGVLTARGAKVPTANAVNKNAESGAWLLGRVARLLAKRDL